VTRKQQEWSRRFAADPIFRQGFSHKMQQYLGDATRAVGKDALFFSPVALTADPLAMGQADQQQQDAALYRSAEEVAARKPG
jgi:hypothetical protein